MNLKEFLKENIVILDGAMGTLLQKQGLKPGEHTESWNISHPEEVIKIHKDYYDAGSHVVVTNTFGANRFNFEEKAAEEIIAKGIENAKRARDESATSVPKFVAFDIGPLGRLLKPLGGLPFEEAVDVFSEMVRWAEKYEPDLFMIETMSDSYETKAALLAVKENSDLPVFVSNAYSENGKLMTGADAGVMSAVLEGMGADAIGANCSFGPDRLAPVIKEYLECTSVPVLVKPNAGMPRVENGETIYDTSPESFAKTVAALVDSGVRIAGGCCGTSPEYISCLAKELKGRMPVEKEVEKKTVVTSYSNTVVFESSPILVGERINPTGKKRLQRALEEKDTDYILKEGLKQQQAGAHVLDVNVGLPQINEEEVLEEVVSALQAVTELPLQIDTISPKAMEKALRVYNGKPLINSVNGTEESMESIFPLVRKYGGVVVALTLDENGIPETAEGRFEIAKKISERAAKYGIDKKDMIFDTLTMAVSAEKNSAKTTIEAMKLIKEKLGCHTILGVSNVSFGLPERGVMNGAFFTMALENGLSAAIMNPLSVDMMKSYHSFRAIKGMDKNFNDYIEFVSRLDVETKINDTEAKTGDAPVEGSLKHAIKNGLKEEAGKITCELLKEREAMDIVSSEVIPALDAVGLEYEAGTVFLPQLLMSAEAANKAFEQVKKEMPSKKDAPEKCSIVIATVEGDIHDIGKNIVKLLLENYGFDVTDLGKDVPAEQIVKTILEKNAPLAGLSALMTTTVPAMEETVRLIHEKAPMCKVIVGGAVLNEEYANKIGADKYCKDAMETVRYAEAINEVIKKDS